LFTHVDPCGASAHVLVEQGSTMQLTVGTPGGQPLVVVIGVVVLAASGVVVVATHVLDASGT